MRKIAIKLQDRAVDPGGPVEREQQRGRGAHRRPASPLAGQWLPPRQLPFRWKCDGCPLFRMIKYRRKNGVAGPNGARPGILRPRKQLLLKTSRLSLSLPRLFLSLSSRLLHRLYRSNGYQSLAGEKRAETRRPSNAIFIYRGPGVTTRERARNINRLPGSINPDRCTSRVVDRTATRGPTCDFFDVHGDRSRPRNAPCPVLITIRGKSKVARGPIASSLVNTAIAARNNFITPSTLLLSSRLVPSIARPRGFAK